MWNQILTLLLAIVFSKYACADWCYQSQVTETSTCKGPDAWKDVNVVCNGERQSPIDIQTNRAVRVYNRRPFWFTGYDELFKSTLKNDGRSGVVVNIPDGATVRGGHFRDAYKAVQLHFHWGSPNSNGSEHILNGVQYPMELHIVHIKDKYIALAEALKDPSGLAVLGFFYEESRNPNENYNSFIEALGKVQDANSEAELNVSLSSLLPSLGFYYRYNGSLTVPGCAEAVIWSVFEDTIPLSKDQLAAFFNLKFNDGTPMVGTFRPVQPLKGRRVFRSHSSSAPGLASFTFMVCLSWAVNLFTNEPNF